MPVTLPEWAGQAPLQPFHLEWCAGAGIELAILRLDLIDPLISGNKWFKLQHHLQAAAQSGAAGVISLGGAHSNHLHALAAAGKRFNFATVGLLRGHAQQTPTTEDLCAMGMNLHWLGYGGYRERHAPGFWDVWLERYPGFYPLPEGGGGELGMRGCAAIAAMLREQLPTVGWTDYDACWLAAGTGTTAAGLLSGPAQPVVHVAMAVPAGHGVEQCMQQAAAATGARYQLHESSRGGFAKVDHELLAFMQSAEQETGVVLEPVYTGKALMSLRHAVRDGYFVPGNRVVFIHTGGLQGRSAAMASL